MFAHHDLINITTPVDADRLEKLCVASGFCPVETRFLSQGFRHGFSIQYQGPVLHKDSSKNLPFRVGDKLDMWQKIMDEVKLNCYARPYQSPLYPYYVQSPIGLVPKANGKTRLIFHLSYDFKEFKSINHYILKQYCKVKYKDLDDAVRKCLRIL